MKEINALIIKNQTIECFDSNGTPNTYSLVNYNEINYCEKKSINNIEQQKEKAANIGLIVGCVAAVVVMIALSVGVGVYFCKRQLKTRDLLGGK
eukprot:Pgem_evm1s5874